MISDPQKYKQYSAIFPTISHTVQYGAAVAHVPVKEVAPQNNNVNKGAPVGPITAPGNSKSKEVLRLYVFT